MLVTGLHPYCGAEVAGTARPVAGRRRQDDGAAPGARTHRDVDHAPDRTVGVRAASSCQPTIACCSRALGEDQIDDVPVGDGKRSERERRDNAEVAAHRRLAVPRTDRHGRLLTR